MSKILATVGGTPITDENVTEFLMSLGQRGQAYNTPDGRKEILKQLISNKLMLLDAKRNLYEAEPQFKAHLAKVKDDLLTSYATEKVLSGVKVSDKDAEEYYEKNKERFVGGESVNASHILVDSEELANEILGKIKSEEMTFEDAAKEYSSCPSKANGGSLGDFGKGQMVPEFDTAVFSMEEGELSSPVKTQFGYHLIRLNSKKAASLMPFSEIAEDIKNALLAEKQRAAYDSKVNQLKILYPVDMLSI